MGRDEHRGACAVRKNNLRGTINPFNPRTEIELVLEGAARVRAELFDVAGRRVAILLDETIPAGSRGLVWDGTDGTGRRVASGSYLLRIESGADVLMRRLTLVQ